MSPPKQPSASDVSTVTPNNGTSNVQADLDALRSQLTPLTTIQVTDPQHIGMEVDNTPEPATPTQDNHRITFFVPQPDQTTVSFGMAAPSPRINDTGITGRTKTHIHFATTTTPLTMLLLGNKTNEGWKSYRDVLGNAQGYAMVTDGRAWTESKAQMYCVSKLGDVIVRAASESLVLQSDAKAVEMFGGQRVTIGSKGGVTIFGASGAHFENPDYGGPLSEEVTKSFGKSWTQWATLGFDNLQTVYGIMSSLWSKGRKKPIWHEPNWKPKAAKEVLSMAADIGKMILTGKGVFGGSGEEAAPEPEVKIVSEKDVAVVAGKGLELFGKMGAGMSSLITCDIIGGTTAMKAATFGGVWAGIIASLKGGLDVAISAEHGDVEIDAKKDVSISADKGVAIQGEKDVQISGKEGSAAMYGHNWAYVGAGTGGGYGLMASTTFMKLGKISSDAKKFGNAAFDDHHGIAQTDSLMTIRMGDTILALSDSEFVLSAGSSRKVKAVKDGDVSFDSAGKILIG